jgi:uncharacterized membrane protein
MASVAWYSHAATRREEVAAVTTAETATLWIHIAAGFLALFAGVVAIVTQKGGPRHRRAGRWYVYAMAIVAGTALLLYGFEQSTDRTFLSLIAIFSFYFAYSGYRVLSRKRPADGPETVDWVALALLGLASLGMLGMGAGFQLAGDGFGIVLLVFGAIGSLLTARDVLAFSDVRGAGTWVGEHVTRMGAGYIATVTAVSTVNFVFLPEIARWLLPTLVGSPLIAYAINRYEREFGLAD